jgi:DnaJ-class molecular chaperone
VKNRRRRLRRQRRARDRAERAWVESELENPAPGTELDATFDEALINQALRRCGSCGGKGWKQRRHKPGGRVVCRVCQGGGSIFRWPNRRKITPTFGYSKVYWHRRWPPRD